MPTKQYAQQADSKDPVQDCDAQRWEPPVRQCGTRASERGTSDHVVGQKAPRDSKAPGCRWCLARTPTCDAQGNQASPADTRNNHPRAHQRKPQEER